MHDIRSAKRWAADYFASHAPAENSVEPDLAERHIAWLLQFALGRSEQFLYANPEYQLAAEEWEQFQSCIKRRLQDEPIEYIMGSASFRTLELAVGPGVLIPRPETEELVELVLDDCLTSGLPQTIVDVCTGSGAIVLALHTELSARVTKKDMDAMQWYATDIDETALQYARQNVSSLDLEQHIDVQKMNLFDELSFDQATRDVLIVSNPPYVPEQARLPKSVSGYEPMRALHAGADGLSIIDDIIDGVSELVLPRLRLWLEIGEGQRSAIESRATSLEGCRIDFYKDFRGVERFVRLEICRSNT